MRTGKRIVRLGGLSAAVLLFVGCGGDDVVPQQPAAVATADEDEGEWVENAVPEIQWVRLEPESPAAGSNVTARVRVNDADGDEIELGFAWSINGRPVRASGDTLPLGEVFKGDQIAVTVTASDGWDESDPVTARSMVGNAPPVLQSLTFDPLGTIHRGQPVTARPIAQDPDGDALEFEYAWWVNDRELSNRSDALDTSRLSRGDEVRVRVVATDGYARSNELVSEPIRVENSPPKIVSSPANLGADGVYRYAVKAEDPDGDRRLRFRLDEAPPGMTIDPISGTLTWTPGADAIGAHTVTVVVDDLQGGVGSQRFSVVIAEEEVPAKPETPTTAAPAAPEDER